jgi:quercetin 2,3-dioxygenase
MNRITHRATEQIIDAVATLEGAGFLVHRSFPTPQLDILDPFLLLDEMGPSDLAPGEAKGAPDHPHRGFETVTYMISGTMEHRDSSGNSGRIGPGDVQWMTAGGGVIHSEMPDESLLRQGGRLHGFQLWVNLPRRDKMMRPRYQEIPAAKIPEAATEDGRAAVRVIAGESMGQSAVIETRTPIVYLHFTLQQGVEIEQPLPPTFNVFAYLFTGAAEVGGRDLRRGQLAVLGQEGDSVVLRHREDEPSEILLVGGEPLREPVARYGPFVMNYHAEIRQAIAELNAGTFTR